MFLTPGTAWLYRTRTRSFEMDEIIILGIVGSLRKDSYNRFALKAAQKLVPDGAVLRLVELHGIPVFNQDTEMALPAAVLEFKRQILAADAILFATPEYNYSVSGVLKNAIDWASRPYGESAWTGKPAAMMGASTGSLGTARAQYHLRQILVTLDMPVVNQPEVMIGDASQRFGPDGRLTDEPTRQLIQKLLGALVQLARTVIAEQNASQRPALRFHRKIL
jgi:chromate reductase